MCVHACGPRQCVCVCVRMGVVCACGGSVCVCMGGMVFCYRTLIPVNLATDEI